MKLTPTIKKRLYSAAVAAVIIAGSVGIASAHMIGPTGADTEFAKAIAVRFNLNQGDVETFLKEQQTARAAAVRAQMKTQVETRLTQLVAAGKLTEAQKQLILAKMTEVEAKLVALQNITDVAARKVALQAIHADVKAWAKQNNIPSGLIQNGFGKDFGELHGRLGKALKAKGPKAAR